MNKATDVQSFTYLGLVASEKMFLKLTNLTLWGYDLQSPLNMLGRTYLKRMVENDTIKSINENKL